jgi:hypothetical protein
VGTKADLEVSEKDQISLYPAGVEPQFLDSPARNVESIPIEPSLLTCPHIQAHTS